MDAKVPPPNLTIKTLPHRQSNTERPLEEAYLSIFTGRPTSNTILVPQSSHRGRSALLFNYGD